MTAQEQSADGDESLDPSEIHNVLRNDRRRQAIKRLRDAEGLIEVDALAEHIAAVETGESPPPRDVRKSVYVSLHQTHLPKLDELDIVDYDQREQVLELRDRAAEVEVYMEVVPEGDISWATYHLGVSALGALVLLGAELDLLFLSSFGVGFWAWYAVALFALSATCHYYSERRKRIIGP